MGCPERAHPKNPKAESNCSVLSQFLLSADPRFGVARMKYIFTTGAMTSIAIYDKNGRSIILDIQLFSVLSAVATLLFRESSGTWRPGEDTCTLPGPGGAPTGSGAGADPGGVVVSDPVTVCHAVRETFETLLYK